MLPRVWRRRTGGCGVGARAVRLVIKNFHLGGAAILM
jgi:hypothetical protein